MLIQKNINRSQTSNLLLPIPSIILGTIGYFLLVSSLYQPWHSIEVIDMNGPDYFLYQFFEQALNFSIFFFSLLLLGIVSGFLFNFLFSLTIGTKSLLLLIGLLTTEIIIVFSMSYYTIFFIEFIKLPSLVPEIFYIHQIEIGFYMNITAILILLANLTLKIGIILLCHRNQIFHYFQNKISNPKVSN